MSTNISKEKREDLLSKINEIRKCIARAEDDENKGTLLTYLSDLEKEVRAKKYGLVFEEHREGIDKILATHIPVMTEESDLFIDNGGPMNFLLEGDNLAALKLLEKHIKEKLILFILILHTILEIMILLMGINELKKQIRSSTANGFHF